MDRSLVNSVEIGHGLSVALTDRGAWTIRADGKQFPLEEIPDFFRAWLLLEWTFSEAKVALDRVAQSAASAKPFPFEKLVGSAIAAESRQWTDRAMAWVADLTTAEKIDLKGLFIEACDSKWASQKSRQLARKYIREIERSA